MTKHILDTKVASEYGVNVALLLENLAYWIHKNLTNKKHIHDGLCWTYNSLEAFAKQFPYWTRRQIETVINNAEKAGLIVKGNYNQVKYDRTIWYALTQKAYGYFDQLQDIELLEPLYLSISPKCEMDLAEWGNGFLKTVTPIPDNKTNNKPYINISASNESRNLVYNEFDKQNNLNEKSDYKANQSEIEKSNPQVIEIEEKPVRSDYFDNQSNIQSLSKTKITYDLKNILEENIFQIPHQAISDWIENRKKKKVPITRTAWNNINKQLAKCQEKGVDPIDAFETMVASGWQSLKSEYFDKPQNSQNKPRINNMDTSWASEVFKPFHEMDLGV